MTDTAKIKSLREFFTVYGDNTPPNISELLTQHGAPDSQNYWKWREELRFQDKNYQLPVWHNKLKPVPEAVRHYVHVSRRDPLFLAYVPNDKYGLADRHVQCKPGKYLAEFYRHVLTDKQIQDYANLHQIHFGPPQLVFARTPDEIEIVYRDGPGSCMGGKGKDTAFANLGAHPTRIYGGPDTCVAYAMKSGKIIARTVINEKDKKYTRIYGEPGLIVPLLKKAGYAEGTLEGCRLLRLPAPKVSGAILVPYIDHVKRLKTDPTDPDKFLIVSESGSIPADNTNGHAIAPKITKCGHCQKIVDRTHPHATPDGLSICMPCANELYILVHVTPASQRLLPKTTPGLVASHDSSITFLNAGVARDSGFIEHKGRWHHPHTLRTLPDGTYALPAECMPVRDYQGRLTNESIQYILKTDFTTLQNTRVNIRDSACPFYLNVVAAAHKKLPTFDKFCDSLAEDLRAEPRGTVPTTYIARRYGSSLINSYFPPEIFNPWFAQRSQPATTPTPPTTRTRRPRASSTRIEYEAPL